MLEGAALKWFMGFITQSIRTWNDMKKVFLDNYLDYCKPTNNKDEVLKMMQREDEKFEDLIERFNYNLKRENMDNLDEDTLKALLLKDIILIFFIKSITVNPLENFAHPPVGKQ